MPTESSQSQSQATEVMEDDDDPAWETDNELDEDEEQELNQISERLNFGESDIHIKTKSPDEINARRVMVTEYLQLHYAY